MVRRQHAADRAIRPKLRSPGHPKYQRHVEVAFWEKIANGLLAEEAARAIGVAQAVGARWFHNAGGMPPFDLKFQPWAAICPLLSARKSRCSEHRTRACGRSLAQSGMTPPPCRVSCVATLPPAAGSCSSTGRRSRSGKPRVNSAYTRRVP